MVEGPGDSGRSKISIEETNRMIAEAVARVVTHQSLKAHSIFESVNKETEQLDSYAAKILRMPVSERFIHATCEIYKYLCRLYDYVPEDTQKRSELFESFDKAGHAGRRSTDTLLAKMEVDGKERPTDKDVAEMRALAETSLFAIFVPFRDKIRKESVGDNLSDVVKRAVRYYVYPITRRT